MILDSVSIEVLDLIEEGNGEVAIEGCVVFVGYAYRDGIGSGVGFVIEGVESPQGPVGIEAEEVASTLKRKREAGIGVRIAGVKISNEGAGGLVFVKGEGG